MRWQTLTMREHSILPVRGRSMRPILVVRPKTAPARVLPQYQSLDFRRPDWQRISRRPPARRRLTERCQRRLGFRDDGAQPRPGAIDAQHAHDGRLAGDGVLAGLFAD